MGKSSPKILSCIARQEMFGVNHVIAVLRGEQTDNIRKWGHESLSTYGLLKMYSKEDLRDWIYQLIGQGALVQEQTGISILKLNDASWEVMKINAPHGWQVARRKRGATGRTGRKSPLADVVSGSGVDQTRSTPLARVRRALAEEKSAALRHYSAMQTHTASWPATAEHAPAIPAIYGVGDAKLRRSGEKFLAAIREHIGEVIVATEIYSVACLRQIDKSRQLPFFRQPRWTVARNRCNPANVSSPSRAIKSAAVVGGSRATARRPQPLFVRPQRASLRSGI